MSSKKNLSSIAKQYPKKHFVAASAVASFLIAIAILPTSEKVSASRTQLDLALPFDEGIAAPQEPSIQASNTPSEKSVNVNSVNYPLESTPAPQGIQFSKEYTVKNGDTLAVIFKKAGFSSRDVYHVAKVYEDATRLHPGETVSFAYNSDNTFKAFKHQKTQLISNVIEKQNDEYQIKEIVREPTVEFRFAQGTINSSLFLDAKEAGLDQTSIMNFANIFGWDIDFVQDLRPGDTFSLMYEELFLDGESIGTGNIVAAEFVNQGQKFQAIRHVDEHGRANYYTPEGKSMRKAFLRSPIDFARISSHFNLRRKHPVLNKIRAHKGTDYAAGRGTPIRTAGDGKVVFAGWKGGFGRCVIIQHGQGIQTLYAHMSKFNKKTKKGTRVSQGQVIGYVGSSGLASGPHLHYEFRVNGVHKNPVKVKLPEARPIEKKYRKDFLADADKWLAILENNQRSVLVARVD
ncbi:peptidoglycan DD-metalloendopeptidase family protein [Litoribrevibacter euphylliae]|uniref:Peptidoglycan DD-metalloendopeptidase family protein n=1 Tax=Litoribrevibacter euphylliae TaxID=1834034 RepID=A0ABV7HI06_9GAMM